ncbi:MAG: hypothetical protein WBC85_10725 [Planktotalea sp.]
MPDLLFMYRPWAFFPLAIVLAQRVSALSLAPYAALSLLSTPL